MTQLNFFLPDYQDASIQIVLAPQVPISGWSIQWDLMYRFNSPQPIISKFLASGYTSGESGITLVNGSLGVFNVSLYAAETSGLGLVAGPPVFKTWRTDSGNATPLNGGYRILTQF